jgi:hypothetical protein
VLSEPALKQLGSALAKLRAAHHLTRRTDDT